MDHVKTLRGSLVEFTVINQKNDKTIQCKVVCFSYPEVAHSHSAFPTEMVLIQQNQLFLRSMQKITSSSTGQCTCSSHMKQTLCSQATERTLKWCWKPFGVLLLSNTVSFIHPGSLDTKNKLWLAPWVQNPFVLCKIVCTCVWLPWVWRAPLEVLLLLGSTERHRGQKISCILKSILSADSHYGAQPSETVHMVNTRGSSHTNLQSCILWFVS